jgi:hypothetical protein
MARKNPVGLAEESSSMPVVSRLGGQNNQPRDFFWWRNKKLRERQ